MSNYNLDDLQPPIIQSLVILKLNGDRIISQHYKTPYNTLETQVEFEKKLHNRVARISLSYDVDIFTIDNHVVLYRVFEDVRMFVIVDIEENELLALMVFNTLTDVFNHLFDHRISSHTLISNLDITCIVLDEIIDQGLIVETKADNIIERVSMKEPATAHQDQTLASAVQSVTDQFFRSLRG